MRKGTSRINKKSKTAEKNKKEDSVKFQRIFTIGGLKEVEEDARKLFKFVNSLS